MSEWKECKLGETGKIITGKTPSKDNPEDWGDEILFITPSDYKDYRKFAYDSIRKLSNTGVDRQKNKLLPPYSVLVTCIGSDMGKSVVNMVPCITNQQINSIIPEKNVVDNNFLYYTTIDLYDTLRSFGGDGTAVPILNKTDFENIDILLPPLPEQRAIASVLSSLDNKIDLLHRQNNTLEDMAETLFRQWFVEEADEGWNVGKIEDFFILQRGFDLPIQNRTDGIYPIFSASGFSGRHTEYKAKAPGVTTGRSGLLGKVFFIIENFWPLNTSLFIKEYKIGTPLFSYFLLKTLDLESYNAGSAVPTLNRNHVHYHSIQIPPRVLIEEFESLMIPNFYKIQFNTNQIRTLEKLRDTLLPKLMNGEVRVEI